MVFSDADAAAAATWGQQGIRCHNDLIVPSPNNSYGHYLAMKKKKTTDSSLSAAGYVVLEKPHS